jgi:hypothetical protein
LTHEFLGFDLPNRKATIWSGGNQKINATTLDSIARTVVYLVANPKSYTNTDVRVHDFWVSQNEILAIAEAETGTKFTVEHKDIEELLETTSAGLAKGDYSLYNIYGVVKAHVFGKSSSARWGEEDDTPAISLPKKDLKEEIKKLL